LSEADKLKIWRARAKNNWLGGGGSGRGGRGRDNRTHNSSQTRNTSATQSSANDVTNDDDVSELTSPTTRTQGNSRSTDIIGDRMTRR
jgi:hypothetical protein